MEVPQIPEKWLLQAGLKNFKPIADHYSFNSKNSKFPVETVQIEDLPFPSRNAGVIEFEKERMLPILIGIKNNSALPPIEAHRNPNNNKLEIKNGFHRFYTSFQLGFKKIPIEIFPYFNIHG